MASSRAAWYARCVCLLLLTQSAGAQDPADLFQRPVRVTTRLVEVSVVAEDKKSKPVSDLVREDFTLFDEGREQPVAFFSVESAQAGSVAPEPLPPNTFTNRLELIAGAPQSVTAILFDGLNTRITDQAYARQQIVKFLEQLQPQDKVALYALGRGVNVLQDFTSDAGALLSALMNYRGELATKPEVSPGGDIDTGVAQFNSWLDELKLNLIDYYAKDRALRTIRSLVAIANHVERLPGRKNLIWVSGSFPVWVGRESAPLPEKPEPGVQSFWPEIERAARALNSANLAIYPVDARGLIAPAAYSPDRARISREAETLSRSGFGTMQVLAERTGGRPFFNNNDLRRALRRAADDSRLTYVLGYHPSHDQWNGQFREIKVRVRRPGVRLRHRRGYFAQPEEPADAWYRDGVLGAAMWSPVDATRLGLTVRVVPSEGSALRLELDFDPRDIQLEPKEGLWKGALDLWMVQLGPNDRHLKTASHVANLSFNQAAFERAMQVNCILLIERLDLAPDASLLRILARDVNSGALGSVSIPLSRVEPRRGE